MTITEITFLLWGMSQYLDVLIFTVPRSIWDPIWDCHAWQEAAAAGSLHSLTYWTVFAVITSGTNLNLVPQVFALQSRLLSL